MFFPDLLNLRKRQVSKHDIDILDWWLGTRKANTRKYLNPLQFSIDCNIDLSHALKLFTICTLDSSVNLLSVRYVVRCPICTDLLDKQEKFLDLSKLSEKRCGNCGAQLKASILSDITEVYFTLLKTKEENKTSEIKLPVGVGMGKPGSLQGSNIKKIINQDDDLGRLFSCLNIQ